MNHIWLKTFRHFHLFLNDFSPNTFQIKYYGEIQFLFYQCRVLYNRSAWVNDRCEAPLTPISLSYQVIRQLLCQSSQTRPEELKGQCHEIFCFWFFHELVSPEPQSIPLGPFQIFFLNLRRNSQVNVHHRY
jgi:hypothetical protein